METVVSITVELQIGSNYLAAECILMVLRFGDTFLTLHFLFLLKTVTNLPVSRPCSYIKTCKCELTIIINNSSKKLSCNKSPRLEYSNMEIMYFK